MSVASSHDEERRGRMNQTAFTFDAIFGPRATQAEVFSRAIEPQVAACLQGFNSTAFCYGPSGTGKTEYAAAHFDSPLVVRRRDDLKRATFHTDGIIFDDMTFKEWEVEEVIHLLSIEKNRSISARYTDAELPAFIFTTNKKRGKIFPRARGEQKRAIARRHRCVEVRGPLQQLGRALTAQELQARRSAGRNGPQGPPARR